MTAAKLIAPAIETSFATGFDWLVTVVDFHLNILTPYDVQEDSSCMEVLLKDSETQKRDFQGGVWHVGVISDSRQC